MDLTEENVDLFKLPSLIKRVMAHYGDMGFTLGGKANPDKINSYLGKDIILNRVDSSGNQQEKIVITCPGINTSVGSQVSIFKHGSARPSETLDLTEALDILEDERRERAAIIKGLARGLSDLPEKDLSLETLGRIGLPRQLSAQIFCLGHEGFTVQSRETDRSGEKKSPLVTLWNAQSGETAIISPSRLSETSGWAVEVFNSAGQKITDTRGRALLKATEVCLSNRTVQPT